jgi:hypothetical protein
MEYLGWWMVTQYLFVWYVRNNGRFGIDEKCGINHILGQINAGNDMWEVVQ